jgi:hypothetical protein
MAVDLVRRSELTLRANALNRYRDSAYFERGNRSGDH